MYAALLGLIGVCSLLPSASKRLTCKGKSAGSEASLLAACLEAWLRHSMTSLCRVVDSKPALRLSGRDAGRSRGQKLPRSVGNGPTSTLSCKAVHEPRAEASHMMLPKNCKNSPTSCCTCGLSQPSTKRVHGLTFHSSICALPLPSHLKKRARLCIAIRTGASCGAPASEGLCVDAGWSDDMDHMRANMLELA